MSEDKFDCKTVSFETTNTGNGTVLKCTNAGDDVELVSTWFAREEDANLWKSFLEYMANAVVHSVKFSEEELNAIIAERDALKSERDDLSSKLDLVKDSIQTMFDSISVDEPTVAKTVVGSEVVEAEEVSQGEIVSFDSLSKLDQARYCKVMGYTNADAARKVKSLYHILTYSDGPSFRELCSEHDDDFIKMFGKPLFNSEAYMSNSVRKHVKQIIGWLSSYKVQDITECLRDKTLHEVAELYKIHPAYLWVICINFKIPFVNDYLPNFNFSGEHQKPGNVFSVPYELTRHSDKVHLLRAYKILGYTFDETEVSSAVGNVNRVLDTFQLNWRKLGTDEDAYAAVYSDVVPFEDGDDYSIENNVAVHKYLLDYMNDIINTAYDWGIDVIAEELKVPVYYLWAFCTRYRINFTAKHRKYNSIHAFVFEEEPK